MGQTMTDAQWQELIEGFLGFKRDNDGCSPRTIEAYSVVLTRLQQYLADRHPLQVDLDTLLVFTGPWLHKLGLGPRARSPYVACVRELYRWLEETRQINRSPAKNLPYPKASKLLPRTMSLESAQALMYAPDFTTFEGVRNAAMLALLMGCGLRVSGLVALNQEDLITITVENQRRFSLRVIEKGKKERRIPVPLEADMLLRVYLEHPQLAQINRVTQSGVHVLFVSTRNRRVAEHEYYGEARRFTTKGVWRMIQAYGKKLGLPADEMHPHAMRHLYGTELAESEVDLLVRQQLLGHASPSSTEIYTHLAARRLVSTIDKANPLSKMKTPVSDLLRKLK